MTERFVIVHRSYDSLQADLLGALLRDAGIVARVTGTRSGAMIGVAQNILEVLIAVPESQAGQATDFLEAFFSAEEAERAEDQADEARADDARTEDEGEETRTDDEGEEARTEESDSGAADEDSDDEQPTPRGRELRPLLAAGSAFLTFGVGHLYARRPATAIALLVGQLVAMFFLIAGRGWHDWTVGLTALAGVVACDVVGSMIATSAHRRGVRRGAAWQAALGAMYVGGSLFLAHVVGPHLSDPKLGDPTGGWRRYEAKSPIDKLDRPLQRDPSFPPLTSQHPANPSARQ